MRRGRIIKRLLWKFQSSRDDCSTTRSLLDEGRILQGGPDIAALFAIAQCHKKESGLSQNRDQPILVVIGSRNKKPLADFLDQFVCARYSSLKSGISAISLLFPHSLKS